MNEINDLILDLREHTSHDFIYISLITNNLSFMNLNVLIHII